MSDTAVAPAASQPEEPLLISDNPAEWMDRHIEKKDAEPTAAAAPPAAPPANPMEMLLPEDFEFEGLRKKPVAELAKSYKESARAMYTAQQRASDVGKELEQARADIAAHKLAIEMAAQARQPQPQADPWKEINDLWFEDPPQAAKKLTELTLAQAKQQTDRTLQTERETTDVETKRKEMYAAGERAFYDAKTALGLDEATWITRSSALAYTLTNPQGAYYAKGGPLVVQNYLDAYKEIFGEPPAPQQAAPPVPSAPPQGNPPGSKRAATQQGAPNAGLPTMSEEKRTAYELIAGRLNIDPVEYIRRIQEKAPHAK